MFKLYTNGQQVISLFITFCRKGVNPIPTVRGQIRPGGPNTVWHFHSLMVRDAKIFEFVSLQRNLKS